MTMGELIDLTTRQRSDYNGVMPTTTLAKIADIATDSGWCGADLADLVGEWDAGDGWTLRITSDPVHCLRLKVIARKGSRATRDLKAVVADKLDRSGVESFARNGLRMR